LDPLTTCCEQNDSLFMTFDQICGTGYANVSKASPQLRQSQGDFVRAYPACRII